jgi:Kef-type K+ transport system membrane component KefB/mannitol/fructose-specific phosphotransferase system IIA component (Ntr-type)
VALEELVNDRDVVVFLLALAVLLGAARLLGELGRLAGLPRVVGEVVSGILLGPTLFGRIAPPGEAWLFAPGPGETMVRGCATVALVLLLVVLGMEIDLGILRRRGRSALATGVLGIVLPAAGGIALGLLLPDADLVDPSRRLPAALLLGVALSVSAIPVIARTLLDLGLLKSDVGLMVMAAAMIDDGIGWVALSLLLGSMHGAGLDAGSFARTLVLGGLLAVALRVLGRRVLGSLFERLRRSGTATPGRVVSAVLVFALLAAAATRAMGLPAALGGFVAGLAAGGTTRVHARARSVVEDFVSHVFAPVFFASVGLRLDFAAFDLPLCAGVFALGMVTKVAGSALGARLGGLKWREATAVGFGMSARGAMGIVLASIARDAGLLGDRLFVALVGTALGTSMLSGPAMAWLLYRDAPEEDVVTLLRRGALVSEMHAGNPADAIHELVRALGSLLAGKKRSARDAVLERERVAPTGLGDEVAIPHAAVEGLQRPLLALGRSARGIDFDAPDGRPARLVFLLLIPPKAYDEEVRILASIARATFDARGREELMAASGIEEVTRVLNSSAKRTRDSMRPKSTLPRA